MRSPTSITRAVRGVTALVVVVLAFWAVACSSGATTDRDVYGTAATTSTSAGSGQNTTTTAAPGTAWFHIALTDVVTGETFTIADLHGAPVFVESFAVWCPTCTRQLLEVKEVLESSDAVLVALNTDPNEDAARVLEHVERNEFAGRFVVSPPELTQLLLQEFGPEIVAVPTAPIILVSADQTETRLLDRGVKPAEKLLAELGASR